jgi:CRISPR-associated protein Cmr2
MSSHLLIIAIGPVQDFIAAARKIRDLWFGSYLLSELSKHVARTVVDQGGH